MMREEYHCPFCGGKVSDWVADYKGTHIEIYCPKCKAAVNVDVIAENYVRKYARDYNYSYHCSDDEDHLWRLT